MHTFGELITYLPATGGTVELHGVFSEKYENVDPATGLMIATYQPKVGIRLSNLPAKPQPGDRVQLRSLTYRVVDCQEDGQGGATLLLHQAA